MQEGCWNDSTLWSIPRTRLIITDYKIFISKIFQTFFNFVHDTRVRNLIVSEIYKNVNLCDWKIPWIRYTPTAIHSYIWKVSLYSDNDC